MKLKLPSRVMRWLREPLLHFVLIGLALFGVYRLLQPGGAGQNDSTKIVLTEDDLTQLTITWRAQGRPPPTQEEMKSLLEEKIRQEVLYREGLKLGFDKDDSIVQGRMVQKIDFLAADLSDLRELKRDDLKARFTENSARHMV